MRKKEKQVRRVDVCSCCGGQVIEHTHHLAKGLVNTLIEVKKFVAENQKNKVHPIKDLKLGNFGYNNFQKLRYFGLMAHYTNPDTKKKEQGYWLLTRNGNSFVKGQLALPKQVRTMSNKISGKSIEKRFLSNILTSDDIPYWDDYKEPVENEITFFPNVYDVDEETPIYDEHGQTKFFY
jgi:hypothetical protein